MRVASFRFVTARLIPRHMRRKQTLLLAAVILAGCGGSSVAKPQVVAGPGYRFAAPAGWKIERAPRQTSATSDSELVRVATFALVKPYRPALFGRVATELAARMDEVAKQEGGTVSGGRAVIAGGVRSHSYVVKAGDHDDEYTFVLVGMREYQLLCRRRSSSSDSACRQLIASFLLR